MLPNHQPLVVAEQFNTLAALFPGRIDLGIGRSLGFTAAVRRALRVEQYPLERFSSDLAELIAFVDRTDPVIAAPKPHVAPSLFVLASGGSAAIAARLGLPVVFGGPRLRDDAARSEIVDRYRAEFIPSGVASEPQVILNSQVLVADSATDAAELALSEAWAYVDAQTHGAFLPLELPASVRNRDLTERQRVRMAQALAGTITGTADAVATEIADLVSRTDADEILFSGSCFDPDAQRRSDRLIAQSFSR